MIVLDASVALKWFADEPLSEPAELWLESVQENPAGFIVPEIFFSECLAVLCRMRDARVETIQESLTLLESLGMTRVAHGHELLELAAKYSISWKLSGYDAIYVALASLVGAVWVTADERAVRLVKSSRLVRLLGTE